MSKKTQQFYTPRWLKGHRDWKYQEALGKLLDGKASPEYVKLRGDKLKETRR